MIYSHDPISFQIPNTMESIRLLIVSLSLFALANCASVEFGKLSDLDDKLFDEKNTVEYVHGERQSEDVELDRGVFYGPMNSSIEFKEIDVSSKGVITSSHFLTTTGDKRSAALGVLNGGRGKSFVNVVFVSEARYIYVEYVVYGIAKKVWRDYLYEIFGIKFILKNNVKFYWLWQSSFFIEDGCSGR